MAVRDEVGLLDRARRVVAVARRLRRATAGAGLPAAATAMGGFSQSLSAQEPPPTGARPQGQGAGFQRDSENHASSSGRNHAVERAAPAGARRSPPAADFFQLLIPGAGIRRSRGPTGSRLVHGRVDARGHATRTSSQIAQQLELMARRSTSAPAARRKRRLPARASPTSHGVARSGGRVILHPSSRRRRSRGSSSAPAPR